MIKTIQLYFQVTGLVVVLFCQSQLSAQQTKKGAGNQRTPNKKSTRLIGEAAAPESSDTIWHRQPAAKWNEGFPIGNGRLGCMMLGKVTRERIQLNEDSLWSGAAGDYYKPNAPAALKQAREMFSRASSLRGKN